MSRTQPTQGFMFASPHDAIGVLLKELKPVACEKVGLRDAFGRVLSEPVLTDRDSPPHDVSAMDGYAVRSESLTPSGQTLEVIDEIAIGQPPPAMPGRGCLKISTGACVPEGCDGVIPREQVGEQPGRIALPSDLVLTPGQNIRRRGENMRCGDEVAHAGMQVNAPVASALASFGYDSVEVYRTIRVAVLTTGDELLPVGARPKPWQIRDSNRSTLLAGLANYAWNKVVDAGHVTDDRGRVAQALRDRVGLADLIVTTGGVSMGDHDYIKPALLDCGAQIVYHKLPIRPGKPGLAGLLPDPNESRRVVPVIGLPGNPVAVAVGLSVFVGPVAQLLAGFAQPLRHRPVVELMNPPARTLGLWRYLPAKLVDDGRVEMLATRGSGDLAGSALADGYVQLPPDQTGVGPWVFYDASL